MLTATATDSVRRNFGYRFPRLGRRLMEWCLRQVPSPIYCELFPGIRLTMNLNDLTQRSTFWQGSRFEAPTARILAERGAGAKAFFDIGANYGFFSYWMLHRLPAIEVYAFEPNPVIFEMICRARSHNALGRLHPQNLGLSDAAGRLDLHAGIEDSGHSTFAHHPGLNGSPVTNVEVLTFDRWVQRIGLAEPAAGEWLAKIDVEGFELKVLSGMRDALERRAFRLLVVEVNAYTLSLTGTGVEQLQKFLNDMGYIRPKNTASAGRTGFAACGNRFFVPASEA